MLTRKNLVSLAEALGGLPVFGCLPGSPAEAAGVRYGDILLSVDGTSTPSWDAYVEARQRSGASIRLRLSRNGTEFEVDVVLDLSFTHSAKTVALALGILDDAIAELN